jgi:rare lipoprotein A (peptidoglycan hydrolase)
MALVPPVAFFAVRDSQPSADTRLEAAPAAPKVIEVGDDEDDAAIAADRLEKYGAQAIRTSRSAAELRIFMRANEEATTTTTEATTTTTAAQPTTTTTAKATTTTAKPTTTTAKPTTTTTAKPTTTAAPTTTTTTASSGSTTSTMGPPPPCCRQEGNASHHDYSDPRTCAHKSLPKGTALRVTNLGNGQRTTCVVNDRGPYVEGRILDLSTAAFSEIANISDGVIRVSIEW